MSSTSLYARTLTLADCSPGRYVCSGCVQCAHTLIQIFCCANALPNPWTSPISGDIKKENNPILAADSKDPTICTCCAATRSRIWSLKKSMSSFSLSCIHSNPLPSCSRNDPDEGDSELIRSRAACNETAPTTLGVPASNLSGKD